MGIVASSLKKTFRLLVWQRIFLFVLDNFRKENLEATAFRSISSKDMGSETRAVGSVSFKDSGSQSYTENSNSHKQNPEASSEGSKNNNAGDRDVAALKVQKVYRSYRTRRNLADCAVVAEELWWQAIEFITLKRTTLSFFDIGKPETAYSRWSRAGLKAAKVGKGLSKDENARKLAFQHWMEAIDPRHRYGHNLHFYYDAWFESDTVQPFFYWLDIGDGKSLDLEVCPRSKLQKQRIKYLGPKEREHYEFVPQNGKLVYKQSGELVDTTNGSEGSKWIFVMSTSKRLFVGQKKKGSFQHSSFLAGGATSAAGRFVVENGILKAIWPHSGHYLPTEQNFAELLNFLEENGIDLSNVEKSTYETFSQEFEKEESMHKENDEGNTQPAANIASNIENEIKNNCMDDLDHKENTSEDKSKNTDILSQLGNDSERDSFDNRDKPIISQESFMTELQMGTKTVESAEEKEKQESVSCKRNLSEELTIEKPEVPRMQLLQRFNSKKSIQSYQLGKQLSLKWSSGVGPRIGCVADYPAELRAFALERVNLSPSSTSPSNYQLPNCVTPKPPKCVTPSSNRSPRSKPPLTIPSPKFKYPLMIPSPLSKSPLNLYGDRPLNTPTKPICTTFS